MNIEQKLLTILNKHLKKYNKKADQKMLKKKLYKDGIIDSFDFINIISDIEKEFKKKIPINKLDADFSLNRIKNEIKK
jgi:acyl carrier protein